MWPLHGAIAIVMAMLTSQRSVFLLLLFLSVTPSVSASVWDFLEGDLDVWEREEERMEEERAEERADAARVRLRELFPLPQQTPPRRSSPGRSFLEVEVSGRTIAFRDVPHDAWFFPYVRFVAQHGIMAGYRDSVGQLRGEFGPGDFVTIAHLSVVSVAASGIDAGACGMPRNASASGSFAAASVACAENEGWAVFSDRAVDVQRAAKRAEVIVTLLQAMGTPFGAVRGTVFQDVSPSTEFASAIERAAADGIVGGDSGASPDALPRFRPEAWMNRAELAKVLSLVVQYYRAGP